MPLITNAFACANNEVAFLSWEVAGMIAGCLGFDIQRIHIDGAEPPKSLAAYVPFPGQTNTDWTPRDTAIWPVQKLSWRDLTLRRHRADTGRRDAGFWVTYKIRPMVDAAPGLTLVPRPADWDDAADGLFRQLAWADDGGQTPPILIDLTFDGMRATFTNGILSGQWLGKALESQRKALNYNTVSAEIKDRQSPIRSYLTGDVLDTVTLFLTDPAYQSGTVKFALYELGDAQLVDLLKANKDRIEVILSNSAQSRNGAKLWDDGNAANRQALKDAGVRVQDRMFNNTHIGHNKFGVWSDAGGVPRAVMTGSTNWTSTGLCGQSNNAVVITSDALAAVYAAQWQALKDDPITPPPAAGARGSGKQGPVLRAANAQTLALPYGPGQVQPWFSPNTPQTSKGTKEPPDLHQLYQRIQAAKHAVLFLCFNPGRANDTTVTGQVLAAGDGNADLLVVGAISDPTAMPGYVAPKHPAEDDPEGETVPGSAPFVHDMGHIHIVRAAALDDIVGDFKRELLKVGNAVVHDKIVVIDPMSPDCCVAFGSHNLGYKASYTNDENLLIFEHCPALALAYATHVLDIYDHYRFRAWAAKDKAEGKPPFSGTLKGDDSWLGPYASRKKGDIGRYFLR